MTEVVAGLIQKDGKFLIGRRPAHKARGLLWEFVGGKVEEGETQVQALKRECIEELAVSVAVGDLFCEVTHTYSDITVHLCLFHAVIENGVPQQIEHESLKWVSADALSDYAFCPADRDIIEKIQASFGKK